MILLIRGLCDGQSKKKCVLIAIQLIIEQLIKKQLNQKLTEYLRITLNI